MIDPQTLFLESGNCITFFSPFCSCLFFFKLGCFLCLLSNFNKTPVCLSLYKHLHVCISVQLTSHPPDVLPDMIWHIIIAVLDIGASSWNYVRLYLRIITTPALSENCSDQKSHLQYLDLTGTEIFNHSLWLNFRSDGAEGEPVKACLRFSTTQGI